jgi:hypothetical protein
MTKNYNFLTIILYLVIISCFSFLIYHCQKNIKEGMENLTDIKKDEDVILGSINTEYGTSELKSINETPYTYFQDISYEAAAPGWKGWNSIGPVMGGSQIDKNLMQAKVTMDLCGNLANTIENIDNQKTLLRLMGINAMGDHWMSLNPEFIKYYKDKMFFLDDIGKYVTGLCSKNSNCTLPGQSGGGGNWWEFGSGNNNNKKSGGDNDWQKNLQDSWNKDTQGLQDGWNKGTQGLQDDWNNLTGGSNS